MMITTARSSVARSSAALKAAMTSGEMALTLPLFEGQGDDAVFGVVGNQLAHGRVLLLAWRRRYPAPGAR
ncbi:hypothetical protein PPS11_39988 [Pseudomonas putida S11]|nr:hypothetical protein PPS11_39988 [Pseudomonas putida S11]